MLHNSSIADGTPDQLFLKSIWKLNTEITGKEIYGLSPSNLTGKNGYNRLDTLFLCVILRNMHTLI